MLVHVLGLHAALQILDFSPLECAPVRLHVCRFTVGARAKTAKSRMQVQPQNNHLEIPDVHFTLDVRFDVNAVHQKGDSWWFHPFGSFGF